MADHADTPDHHDDHDHGVGHVVPIKYLIANGLALIVLTFITVGARYLDFGAFNFDDINILLALAIAVVKASLVCLFFMHLFWDRQFNSIILVGSLFFVILMIGLTMLDSGEYETNVAEYRERDLAKYKTDLPAAVPYDVQAVKDRIDGLEERMKERMAHDGDHHGDDHGDDQGDDQGDDHGDEAGAEEAGAGS